MPSYPVAVVIVSKTLVSCGLDKKTHGLQLMIPGKDEAFFFEFASVLVTLVFNLEVEKTGQEIEQAVPV